MPNDARPPFVVVGGGLVGSMLAALLGREGFPVELIERRGDPRDGRMEGGRSINLAISVRGLHALAKLDLDDELLALGVPLYRRAVHPRRSAPGTRHSADGGGLAYQAYGDGTQAINSFSRGELNRALIVAAGKTPNVVLSFGRRCVDVDLQAGTVSHVDAETGGDARVSRGIVVGADGAFSAVRPAMQKREYQEYAQSYLEHGYKELFIPARADGSPALEVNVMHIWPRGRFMMMAMANRDGSFTVTLYLPRTGENGFDRLTTDAAVREFFEREFPDAVPLMPSLIEDFFANPTGAMVTIRTYPWQVGGRAVLIGDAAHAIVPFYGQGANCGFEDCLEFIDQVKANPADLDAAFERYQQIRKPNAEAIADLALANFHEMRDHIASPMFLWKKRVEKFLAALLPGWYRPLYPMIAFSLVPYAEARARAAGQARTLRRAGWSLGVLIVVAVWILLSR